jgi:hypothetical protein
MPDLLTVATPFALMALFLAVGLFCYDRWGVRLGGVLVLPLLLSYVLRDINVLAVFGIAATASYAGGHLAYQRTFVYGRRLLYLFLLLGIAATLVTLLWIPLQRETFVMALLPGLFAYNLHREGRVSTGLAAFLVWFALLLAIATLLYWLAANPGWLIHSANAANAQGVADMSGVTDAGTLAATGTLAVQAGGAAE